ncbi:hypothetical protein QAD02_020591 [Eretmocerus hayati]|uniref:Uncharacterized protein n=1 Tax=Eretmocerus hayati TaxID=131215 RepID=A0ACC2PNV9_9HYME|nr:hypothetical protein QAD02_020591 [Eretmocerus hayati]
MDSATASRKLAKTMMMLPWYESTRWPRAIDLATTSRKLTEARCRGLHPGRRLHLLVALGLGWACCVDVRRLGHCGGCDDGVGCCWPAGVPGVQISGPRGAAAIWRQTPLNRQYGRHAGLPAS